ncbi:heat shock 70 kDa protein 12A-like [Mytilus galloprovincialis]|uniref:heat shock 70 kDa protein 12A-like n=1 Tax=Mytilus galloprovincialis TaxID=29158 RepID=UPI003F7BACB3
MEQILIRKLLPVVHDILRKMATGDSGNDILMVAAIDIGTTYSGYAYSFRGEYEKDKLNIDANQIWNAGSQSLLSLKTPTCILINQDTKKFVSFGFEAENAYRNAILDKKADMYYFFDKFKMVLHENDNISKDMEIGDVRGNMFPAIEVFALAIGALTKSLIDHIKKQKVEIQYNNEIKWVLTVPAIWNDKAKEFMRISAVKAGIRADRLVIALEPEVASIYCQHLPKNKITAVSDEFSVADGINYLVVDLGGGTVDITAHHKINMDNLEELSRASGGACGGTTVDKEFLNLFECIVGKKVMKYLRQEHTVEYMNLMRTFETIKRKINSTPEHDKKINFTVPLIELDLLCQRFLEKDFKTAILEFSEEEDTEVEDDGTEQQGSESSQHAKKQTIKKGQISLVGSQMRVDEVIMSSLFDTACTNIVMEISNVLQNLERTNLKTFLLVGGFSESPLIQEIIRQNFPDINIISPEDPVLAVLKGAVLFGHKPDFITSRFTRHTYGRRIRPLFDESQHDPKKRVTGEDGNRCRDVFESFMKINKKVPLDTVVTLDYHTVDSNQTSVSVAIYCTYKDKTDYVDDEGCKKLAEFSVPIPDPSGQRRYVDVEIKFGMATLDMTATERQTGEKTQHHCSL